MQYSLPNERPLSAWAKTGLVASTAAIILLFYLFTLLAGVALLALLVCELMLVLALARIGLATWMARIMRAHIEVVKILLGSLWLRSRGGAEFQIALGEGDAPKLFEMLRALSARFQVAPPSALQLEMSVNAWVRLEGLRSGSGETRLGIGYDLLSGLSVSEMEAVLAHEMAHAKLVQRGFKKFANSALSRCGLLVDALVNHVRAGREIKQERRVAELFYKITDALIKVLARFVAAYSRQDEFEADRGACDLCGSQALRSALLKLRPLNEASARLPWRERVAQLQSGKSFSEWFARELASNASALANSDEVVADNVFDKYATHPLLQDRLAALPAGDARELNSAPALGLLASPDATAEKLVDEIQRVSALQEAKDSKQISKWARGEHRRSTMSPLQCVALCVVIVAGIASIYGMAAAGWKVALSNGVVALAAFFFMAVWRAKYKDCRDLPVPDYAELVEAGDRKMAFDQQDAMAKEFDELAAKHKRKKQKVAALLDEAYKALSACDYLRAHAAARAVINLEKKSVEGHLAFAIAAAVMNQANEAAQALGFVQFHTGFRSRSTAWGAAWAFTLLGYWLRAESLLDYLVENHPEEKTFLCLLAVARSRRGKSNSAIATARAVCTPSARNKQHARLLIGLLLDSGLLREASSRLAPLEKMAETDHELQLQMLRLKLLTQDWEGAEHWTAQLLQYNSSMKRRLQLGHLYHQARQFPRAAAFFMEVQKEGHYPEALLALSQIEGERRNKQGARELAFQALNLYAPVPEGATGPLQLFHPLLAQIGGQEDVIHCSAWHATVPSTGRYHKALANATFLVYGPNEAEARRHASSLLRAMEPSFNDADLVWKPAPQDEQPVRPVYPGVQGVATQAS